MKIITETPTEVKGITQVQYEMPTKDPARNVTGNYKGNDSEPFKKTVYDAVFTDDKILQLGQQASAIEFKAAMKSKNGQASVFVEGVSFSIYVDKTTGIVRNFHPN